MPKKLHMRAPPIVENENSVSSGIVTKLIANDSCKSIE